MQTAALVKKGSNRTFAARDETLGTDRKQCPPIRPPFPENKNTGPHSIGSGVPVFLQISGRRFTPPQRPQSCPAFSDRNLRRRAARGVGLRARPTLC